VLVVEDDEDIREILLQCLELEGYAVESAADGKQGLERITGRSLPCFIVLDLMMPVMDGWELLDSLERDTSLARIPVAIVSAVGHSSAELQARHPSVKGFFAKPIESGALLDLVGRHCARSVE